jgi:hypothetical protein
MGQSSQQSKHQTCTLHGHGRGRQNHSRDARDECKGGAGPRSPRRASLRPSSRLPCTARASAQSSRASERGGERWSSRIRSSSASARLLARYRSERQRAGRHRDRQRVCLFQEANIITSHGQIPYTYLLEDLAMPEVMVPTDEICLISAGGSSPIKNPV